MKHAKKTVLCALTSLALCAESLPTWAASSDTPYQAIVDRNVFGLKPPPPPAPDPASVKPPAPKLTLLGITTLLGKKRALLKFTGPAKPGEQAKETSLMLAEGQRDGDIEVIQVDEKVKSVTVDDFGTPTVLTMDKDSPKTTSAPAPGGPPPGAPAMPSLPSPTGGTPAPPLRTIPTRSLRSQNADASASAGNGMVASAPGFGMASTGAVQPRANTPQPNEDLSLEQQMLMIEAERERTKDLVNAGKLPPLPPTPFTPAGSPGSLESAPELNNEAATPSSSPQRPRPRPGFPAIP